MFQGIYKITVMQERHSENELTYIQSPVGLHRNDRLLFQQRSVVYVTIEYVEVIVYSWQCRQCVDNNSSKLCKSARHLSWFL